MVFESLCSEADNELTPRQCSLYYTIEFNFVVILGHVFEVRLGLADISADILFVNVFFLRNKKRLK